MKLLIPKILIDYIDSVKGDWSRAKYILHCVDYVRKNNININLQYEGNINDRNETHVRGGEDINHNKL